MIQETAPSFERVATKKQLEAGFNASSTNSSLPPSKNPPHIKVGHKSKPTGKPPGGRPGHIPHFFAAIAPTSVTWTVDCEPASRCDYKPPWC